MGESADIEQRDEGRPPWAAQPGHSNSVAPSTAGDERPQDDAPNPTSDSAPPPSVGRSSHDTSLDYKGLVVGQRLLAGALACYLFLVLDRMYWSFSGNIGDLLVFLATLGLVICTLWGVPQVRMRLAVSAGFGVVGSIIGIAVVLAPVSVLAAIENYSSPSSGQTIGVAFLGGMTLLVISPIGLGYLLYQSYRVNTRLKKAGY